MQALRQRSIQLCVGIGAWLCSFFAPITVQLALADQLVQEAEKGQNTGANFLLNYNLPTVSDAPPGSALGPNEVSSTELFPGYVASPTTFTPLENMQGNPSSIATTGFGAQLALGSGTSPEAEAYQAIEAGSANPNHDITDIRSEIFLDISRDILQGESPWIDEILMSCEQVTIDGGAGIDTTTHLEDLQTCSQAQVGDPEDCTLRRDVQFVPVVTQTILSASSIPQTCGSGYDLQNWSFAGFTSQTGVGGADFCTRTTAPFDDVREPFVEYPGSAMYTAFCGDLDSAPPTRTNCKASALELEHICRNAAGGASGTLNPDRGAIGACSGPGGGDYTQPVDYTLCDAQRQAYCETVYDEYLEECDPLCGTDGGVDSSALFPGDSDGDGLCEIELDNPTGADWSAYPPLTSGTEIIRYDCLEPWMGTFCAEPTVDTEHIWTNYYCGDLSGLSELEILRQCTQTANDWEATCNSLSVQAPGPGNIEAIMHVTSCAAQADALLAACTGPPGSPGLMNGVDSVIASALPAASSWEANAWGAEVQFDENVIDPTNYGLAPGQYLVSDFQVTGVGVNGFNVLDGGSYGSNWDYGIEVDLTDSDTFDVAATLYQIVENDFEFVGCDEAGLQSALSSGCVGAMQCNDLVVPCRVVDGVQVCERPGSTDGITELLSPWDTYVPGIAEMCWEATVELADCTVAHDCFTSGDCTPSCDDLPPSEQAECLAPPCWINASDGTEVCLDSTTENWVNNLGEPGYVDDCQDLLIAPNCSLLPQRECVEGMEGVAPGDCFLRTVFFDCGTDVTIPGIPGADDEEITCSGDFRCFGEECANKTAESNPDFVRAATAASAITEMTKDLQCDVSGDPGECKLFVGSDNRCKDPRGSWIGIIPDCCKDAREGGASVGPFSQYMQLAFLSYEVANKPMVAGFLSQSAVGNGLSSVINGVGDPVAQAVGSVTNAISTGFSSAMSWMGFTPVEAVAAAPGVVADVAVSPTTFGPLQQFIATGVNNFLNSVGLGEFAAQLFNTTAEGTVTGWASSGLGELVGNIVNVIGTIYMIYSILRILGNIFFACEEEELEFGIQMVNRMCHYVGTYCSHKVTIGPIKKCVIEKQVFCCFGSPLARIMNEQLRLQGIGGEWGPATDPNCEGISIHDLSGVDWALVNLTEWEAIMFEAGLMPNPQSPPENFVPTDIFPGASSGGTGEGADSVTLIEETIDTVIDPMDEGRFLLEGEPLTQTDPELMPWYED